MKSGPVETVPTILLAVVLVNY